MKDFKEVQEKVYAFVEEIAGMPVLDADANLVQDMMFDSIKMVMLYASIEDEYDIILDFEQMDFEKYVILSYIVDVTYGLLVEG